VIGRWIGKDSRYGIFWYEGKLAERFVFCLEGRDLNVYELVCYQ
jgi:hypothetical protein